MQHILIVGASGHAKVVADIVGQQGDYCVAGFVERGADAGGSFFGLPILGDDADLPRLVAAHEPAGIIVAIGDNWLRGQVVYRLRELLPDAPFLSAVHPAACVAPSATIGAGSVVMAGAVLGPDAALGEHCILNSAASVDHDTQVEDFASIAPGAVLGGNVSIGTFSAVSLGARVIQGVCVGKQSVLGAGAVAVRDVPPGTVAYGVPARTVRSRKPGDPYL